MKPALVSPLLCLVVGAAACGGSELDPGAGHDPGDGTGTLQIEGSVRAESRLAGAINPGDFDTEFSVDVLLNSVKVTTGSVKLTSLSGTIELAYDPNSNNGRWRGTAAGYDEVYVLDVVSGADNVLGVRVDGPDIHTFRAPLAGATVDTTMPLDVTWAREDEADSAAIRTENLDNVAIADTGSYAISPGGLKAERDQPRENEIRISRTNRVIPAGGAAGSVMEVSVRNMLSVIAQPNPAL